MPWAEGVAALATPSPPERRRPSRWYPGINRIPIVITGASGAGKTEIWRRLTGRDAPDALSRRVDEGYLFRSPSVGRRKSRVAITTIPGQNSKERLRDLAFYFSPRVRLVGVVFVASFGFNRIWPGQSNLVGNQLGDYTIEGLGQRNIQEELVSFRDVCGRLLNRHIEDRNLPMPWLLVLVNKADLFISAIDQARAYYLPAPAHSSPFDREAHHLANEVGSAAQFRYDVIPVAARTGDYRFSANRGVLMSDTQLSPLHANTSVRYMTTVVEELCYE